MLSIQKLDKRFAGHRDFQYRIGFIGYRQERVQQFLKVREWCWDTWGPGCERDYCYESVHKPIAWTWFSENGDEYIYLKDNALLTHFQLIWM